MRDMTPDDLHGAVGVERVLVHADGTRRTVFTVDREVPFPDGRLVVSRTDTKGVITQANESFVAMSGYALTELLGESHNILRHPDMPAAVFRDLWATVSSGRRWTGYVKNLRKDGAYYWVYASIVPNVRAGQVVGYTSVRRKPSRRKVVEAESMYAVMR